MKAIYGKVENVRVVPSRAVTQVIVELPAEAHVAATALLYDQKVLLTLAPAELAQPYGIVDSEAPPAADAGPAASDGSTPSRQQRVGPICQLAVQWCRLWEFQHWIANAYPRHWNEHARELERGAVVGETVAKRVLCDVCGVGSRRELDTDTIATACFMDDIRQPYMEWIAQRKGDAQQWVMSGHTGHSDDPVHPERGRITYTEGDGDAIPADR